MTQQLETTTRPSAAWDEQIQQLLGAPDRQAFCRGMLDLQCKVVAAEYGAMWAPASNGELQAVAAWPKKLTEQSADHPIIKMLAEAATSGMERGKSHVLKIEADGDIEGADPGLGAHVFVTAMKTDGKVRAVTTVVADCRDPKVIQTSAPMRELAAGLLAGYEAKQSAVAFQRDADNVRNAMALLAVSQEGRKFHGSALNLVNELARQLKCTRVTIGWIKGAKVKLVSMSDTENLKRHSEDVANIELSMAECLDQQHPIVYPVPEDAEPLLQHAVVHAHRKLTGEHPNRYVVSIPMRVEDDWVGVLTLERQTEPFDSDLIQQVQLVVDVVTPHLADRRVTSRWLPVHAWYSFTDTAGYLVGPKHVGWKLVGLLAFVGFLFIMLGWWRYDVSSEFVFDAEKSRIVSAPFEAELDSVLVEPSEDQMVKAGDVLARLDVSDKILELTDVRQRLTATRIEYERALSESELAEAKQAAANMKQYEAQAAVLTHEIERATIKAPIDGYVIEGDWKDKIGSVVPQGERMFEIAQRDRVKAKIRVSEFDIDELRREMEIRGDAPMAGLLRTGSRPDDKFRFTVDKIMPMASPVEGANVFEVHASFDTSPWDDSRRYERHDTATYDGILYRAIGATGPETAVGPVAPPAVADLQHLADATRTGGQFDPEIRQRVLNAQDYWQRADWLRKGMEGTADIHAGRRPIRWLLTHQIVDTVKLWTWWPF